MRGQSGACPHRAACVATGATGVGGATDTGRDGSPVQRSRQHASITGTRREETIAARRIDVANTRAVVRACLRRQAQQRGRPGLGHYPCHCGGVLAHIAAQLMLGPVLEPFRAPGYREASVHCCSPLSRYDGPCDTVALCADASTCLVTSRSFSLQAAQSQEPPRLAKAFCSLLPACSAERCM